jgi:hypothetical protein
MKLDGLLIVTYLANDARAVDCNVLQVLSLF